MDNQQFEHVGQGDGPDKTADDQFYRAESLFLERQDRVRYQSGHGHAREQRQVKQQ